MMGEYFRLRIRPNRYFPFEVHTRYLLIHWLPKTVFDKILSYTPKKWAAGDYIEKSWFEEKDYLA
jgi:hypothetical protein